MRRWSLLNLHSDILLFGQYCGNRGKFPRDMVYHRLVQYFLSWIRLLTPPVPESCYISLEMVLICSRVSILDENLPCDWNQKYHFRQMQIHHALLLHSLLKLLPFLLGLEPWYVIRWLSCSYRKAMMRPEIRDLNITRSVCGPGIDRNNFPPFFVPINMFTWDRISDALPIRPVANLDIDLQGFRNVK